MTATDDQGSTATAAPTAHRSKPGPTAEEIEAAGTNPGLLGLPVLVVGGTALGLFLIGFTGESDTALVGMVPILFMATGLGQLVATIWAIRIGSGAVAAVFGTFTGFWLSFALLATSLGNDWFGPTSTDEAVATGAQETFLLAWLIGIVVLTVASLRLPSVFTLLFVLVDAALLLVLLGTSAGSTALLFGGGLAVFGFTLVAVYLFVDAMGQATGGRPLPMGKPIISG